MNLILFGPPSAGKGSQAKKLVEEYDLKHISTGDIFRHNISMETEIGLEAKKYMDRGDLVPDEVTIEMVRGALEDGFILDGFPRTVKQAIALDEIIKDKGLSQPSVIRLVVDDEQLIDRVTGRRISPTCGASYHIKNNPPKVEGICDVCGDKLIQRSDDTVELFKDRLTNYYKQTLPCVEYYKEQSILHEIDGNQSIAKTFEDIKKVIDQL